MISPILPTVKTGCRRGTTPKLYWKNPRPMGMQGANPRDLRQISWTVCNHDSGGFFTWSYKLVSPKENTGTSGVLKIHTKRITNVLRYLKSRIYSRWLVVKWATSWDRPPLLFIYYKTQKIHIRRVFPGCPGNIRYSICSLVSGGLFPEHNVNNEYIVQ